ncbi:sensor histidine kinase [Palleronia abyssalis]|uniref:histidine kinase n=1 Tax=Palleronia abyssalis TaxID=1501240 RepID=A0A2R8BWS0_9RHOB|nr:PAS domain-containing protein [Palleronia abyssalis]SPJ24608.1 Blue-light-activated histidine kinase [Palleronia abyssalis]
MRTKTIELSFADAYPGLGSYVWRPADGRLDWSPGLARIYGRGVAPSTEAEFMSCLHPDDRLRVEGETESFLTGSASTYSHSFRILRPDGEVRWLVDRAWIERDAQGRVKAIHGVNIDVTESRHLDRVMPYGDEHDVELRAGQSPRNYSDWAHLEIGARTGGIALATIDYRAGTFVLSAAAARLFGLGDAEMTVSREAIHATFHPDDRGRVESETRAAINPSSGGRLSTEHRILRPDGSVRWVRVQKRIDFESRDGQRHPDRGILAAVDISEQKRAETELQESEERLALAQEVAAIGVWDLNLNENSAVWTDKLYDLLQIERGTPPSVDLFYQYVHPEDIGALRQALQTSIDQRLEFHAEFRIVRPDGKVRYFLGRGRVVEEVEGHPVRMIGVNYDITERKEQAAHTEFLLEEVNHRAKNMISLIGVIAKRTAESGIEGFTERFSMRLSALAANQDLLVSAEWKTVDLEDLVRAQLAHFKDLLDRRILIEGPALSLSPAAAERFGMALNELATNAAKYGALSRSEGVVQITWRIETDGEAPCLVVVWQEAGGPSVNSPTRKGFGSLVSGSILEAALNGKVEANYAEDGLRWTMRCLLDHIANG